MRRLSCCMTLCGVATLGTPSAAQPAPPDTSACITAYEHAQELRLQSHLVTALDELRICARDVCPEPLRGDCVKWAAEVEGQLPSVVFVARDAGGRDLKGARVTLDGASSGLGIDGHAVTLDPGAHRARFEVPGGEAVDVDFIAQPGEHDRAVSMVLASPAAPAQPVAPPTRATSSSGGPPWAALTLGAVGVLALGAGAYVGISTKSDVDALRDECAPRCDASKVDDARGRLHLADALMATGVVAIGVGTILYFSSRTPAGEHGASTRAGATRIGLRPVSGGGLLSLRRSF